MIKLNTYLSGVFFIVVCKSLFMGSFLPSDTFDVFTVLWCLCLPEDFTVVCKSFLGGAFLSSAILDICSVLWRLCLPDETHNAQIGVLHFLHYRAHVFPECFEHLGVDPRISNDTITCSSDLSEICSPSQSSQRCI